MVISSKCGSCVIFCNYVTIAFLAYFMYIARLTQGALGQPAHTLEPLVSFFGPSVACLPQASFLDPALPQHVLHSRDDDMLHSLQASDERLSSAVSSGCIRFVSVHWLLCVRPNHYSMIKLPRRQELEEFSPSPFMSEREAAAALKRGCRHVIALTYGWGSPGDPDPTNQIFEKVIAFLKWFSKEFSLSESDLKSYGLFWE